MCLHPELVLMKKGWLVQVTAGQGEMMKLRKRLRNRLIMMMVKMKKGCLMWKKSTLLTMLIWDLLCSMHLQTLHGE
jgi:hypothetical protein